jgi:hypothetical protein
MICIRISRSVGEEEGWGGGWTACAREKMRVSCPRPMQSGPDICVRFQLNPRFFKETAMASKEDNKIVGSGPGSTGRKQDAAAVAEYWTPERMAAAIPVPMPKEPKGNQGRKSRDTRMEVKPSRGRRRLRSFSPGRTGDLQSLIRWRIRLPPAANCFLRRAARIIQDRRRWLRRTYC